MTTPKRMSDEAVQAKTGKTWKEWFKLIDTAGGQKMTHQEIVALLRDQHNVGGWWQQMVTVTYEQAKGKRKLHEMPDGFQISTSKTFNQPVSALYQAWLTPKARATWLPKAKLTIRTKTRHKSLRILWGDQTRVEASFYAKGETKCQLVVQHSKLATAREAAKQKAYWAKALAKLQEAF